MSVAYIGSFFDGSMSERKQRDINWRGATEVKNNIGPLSLLCAGKEEEEERIERLFSSTLGRGLSFNLSESLPTHKRWRARERVKPKKK